MNEDIILKEVAQSLAQRKRLCDKTHKLQNELASLEVVGGNKTGAPSPQKTPQKSPRISSSHSSPGGSVGNKVSPRRRNDSPRSKTKGDKNQPESMETFDAHLKNIITNALMGEAADGMLGGPSQKKGPSPGRKSPVRKDKPTLPTGNKDFVSMSCVQDSAIRMALLRKSSPDRHPNHVLKKSPPEENCRIRTAGGMPSIKVTIPLGDVGKRPPSLPVSISLASVKDNLGIINKDGHVVALKEDVHRAAGARSGSPHLREAYSPISRPSSSSSTISAESVKHLEHGTRVPATSPKGFTPTTYNFVDSAAASQANTMLSLSKHLAVSHAAAVSGKDPTNGGSSFSPLMLQERLSAARMPPPPNSSGSLPGMLPPGAGFPFPIPDKELYLKMLENGPRLPYGMPTAELAAQASFLGLNGLQRGEDKINNSKKARRKRTNTKGFGGGGGGGGLGVAKILVWLIRCCLQCLTSLASKPMP